MKKSKKKAVLNKRSLIYIGITLILIAQLAVYNVQLFSIKRAQKDLQTQMESAITTRIIKENPVANARPQVSDVATGSVTNPTEEERAAQLADTVASLVINQLSEEYKNELKDLVVQSLMDDIDGVVKKYYSDYAAREANDIASSVKVIVLEELKAYTDELKNEVYETKNLYTSVQNSIATLRETQTQTNAKLAEIQSTYSNEIAKLKQKDSDLQSQIDTLKGSQKSNTNELTKSIEKANKAFDDALKKLQGTTLNTNEDIYTELDNVRKALEAASTNLKSQITSLDVATANNLRSEIDARKKAIEDAIAALQSSDKTDKEYLIRLLSTTKQSLTSDITDTAADLAAKAQELSEVDEANRAEYLEEIKKLNQNIEILNNNIQYLRDNKLNIVDSPTYDYNQVTNSLTVTVPSAYPNQQ